MTENNFPHNESHRNNTVNKCSQTHTHTQGQVVLFFYRNCETFQKQIISRGKKREKTQKKIHIYRITAEQLPAK